jgi:hypothetical protein
MTEDEARDLVLARLASRQVGGPDGVAITRTERTPYGWAFYYNSRRFMETRELAACLIGHGPVVVVEDAAEVHELGSQERGEDAIAALELELGLRAR